MVWLGNSSAIKWHSATLTVQSNSRGGHTEVVWKPNPITLTRGWQTLTEGGGVRADHGYCYALWGWATVRSCSAGPHTQSSYSVRMQCRPAYPKQLQCAHAVQARIPKAATVRRPMRARMRDWPAFTGSHSSCGRDTALCSRTGKDWSAGVITDPCHHSTLHIPLLWGGYGLN